MDPRVLTVESPLRLTWRWWLALLPLIVLAHEAHEQAHTVAGRLRCGEWALRDFSTWSLSACDSLLPIATGPLFSYLLMLAGAVACARPGPRRACGLALVAAANPLARVITAASGHGDEWQVVHRLADAHASPAGLYALTLAIVLLPAGAAMLVAWWATRHLRARVATYAALMVSAMAVTGPGALLGNRWLHAGVLDPSIAGAPGLVHLVTIIALLAALLSVRNLRGA